MASKRDIEIASLLFRSGICSQEEIQSALGHQGTLLTEGQVVSLIEVLVERGLIPEDAAASFTEEPLERLQPLPDYNLVAQVGDGASARVYRGVYLPRELPCAVKILHPEQELQSKALRRFMREAHLLCKLRHPNIVQGYEVRKVNGFRFLSMEWFDGGTLLEEIDRRGHLDGPTALHVTKQIASALGHLYGKGIVHRDIKPGNVLIDTECDAKLIDLGLCRLVAQETDESEGTTVGTVGYISPEQAKGVGDLDIRSDIYSLGVSLYHMVVGEVPFSGDDDFEVMSKQIMQSLRSDRIKSLNISPHVHYAIEKMMAKDRDIRFQHPNDIVTDIDAYLTSVDFKPIPTAQPVKDEVRTKRKAPSKKQIDIVPKKKERSGKKPRAPISRRRRRHR
ncbi:MAG: serine/threonine protein kinase [Planctomycetota bacterium]|jgi:serine/threonine-protein kinase